MRLHDPWWLCLLPVAAVCCLAGLTRKEGRVRFSSLSLMKRIGGVPKINPRLILQGLRFLAVGLFIAAMARPQAGKKFTEIASEGVDIILALDMSGSMQALDLKIDGKNAPRVEVVKKVAGDFVRKRETDRVGLVVFGERAFVQCPMTLDHQLLEKFLNEIHSGIAGDSTAIGDAIGVAVNHMKDLKAKSRVVVLLTDGQNNTGVIPPLKAAELARIFNVKVYTIGVGVEGQAPFLVDTPIGKRIIYQKADLDEVTLKEIAKTTNARFFRAQDTETLRQIYDEIDRLEKTEVKVKEYAEYQELYAWFLIPGLLILLTEVALGQTLLGKVP